MVNVTILKAHNPVSVVKQDLFKQAITFSVVLLDKCEFFFHIHAEKNKSMYLMIYIF